MSASYERWPTPFEVKRISDSVPGKDLSFFFVSGVLRQGQYDELAKVINILAVHRIEEEKLVALSNETVRTCEDALRN